jgi:hypothetical protein
MGAKLGTANADSGAEGCSDIWSKTGTKTGTKTGSAMGSIGRAAAKITMRSSLVVSGMAALLLAGCGPQRHLAGEGWATGGSGDGTGGAGTGTDTGGAGSSAAGMMGNGSGGGGASVPAPRPLPVSPSEAVTQASRLLWQMDPDPALMTMAESGALVTTEDLRKLALRLEIDARARSGVADFYRWWLDLDRVKGLVVDTAVFPQPSAALLAAMEAETETFAVFVTLDGDGSFTTLLTAPFTFVNEPLASIYRIGGISGTELRRVALDPSQRGGLFTQPGILAMNSHPSGTSPTLRGLYLRQRLLCQDIPAAPPDVPPLPPPTGMTMRERITTFTANPACVACHQLTDPLGFAFEHFDAIGQYRETDNGTPIDASGQVTLRSGPMAFQDAGDLMALLARAPEAQTCMAEKWLQYALGGRILTDREKTFVDEAQRWFASSGFNLRDLVAAVIQSEVFLTHQPVCTPGADQTCNADPRISSLHGHCTEARRCTCQTGDLPDPTTGRCY